MSKVLRIVHEISTKVYGRFLQAFHGLDVIDVGGGTGAVTFAMEQFSPFNLCTCDFGKVKQCQQFPSIPKPQYKSITCIDSDPKSFPIYDEADLLKIEPKNLKAEDIAKHYDTKNMGLTFIWMFPTNKGIEFKTIESVQPNLVFYMFATIGNGELVAGSAKFSNLILQSNSFVCGKKTYEIVSKLVIKKIKGEREYLCGGDESCDCGKERYDGKQSLKDVSYFFVLIKDKNYIIDPERLAAIPSGVYEDFTFEQPTILYDK